MIHDSTESDPCQPCSNDEKSATTEYRYRTRHGEGHDSLVEQELNLKKRPTTQQREEQVLPFVTL
jgi:hypothetical protein